MNYYILRHDWELNLLKSENPLWIYAGKPLNFGGQLGAFPKIRLKFGSNELPDSIPNVNGCIIFNQKIISILKEAGADYIQYFRVDVEDSDGTIVSDDYKCLNIIKTIDAIDLENSKLDWSDVYGDQTQEDRYIMGIRDLRLDYSKVNNEPLFVLKRAEHPLVFREDVAQAIVNEHCTGLEFYPVEGYGD